MRLIGRDDAVAIQDRAPRQFFDFSDGVQHTPGDVFKRRFDGGRRFATIGLAILVPDLFDQDGLCRGAAAVGGDDDVQWTVDRRCIGSDEPLQSSGGLRFDGGDQAGNAIASFQEMGDLCQARCRSGQTQ